jgi:hypothetical protein
MYIEAPLERLELLLPVPKLKEESRALELRPISKIQKERPRVAKWTDTRIQRVSVLFSIVSFHSYLTLE